MLWCRGVWLWLSCFTGLGLSSWSCATRWWVGSGDCFHRGRITIGFRLELFFWNVRGRPVAQLLDPSIAPGLPRMIGMLRFVSLHGYQFGPAGWVWPGVVRALLSSSL